MPPEQHPVSASSLRDDQLATAAVSLVISELQWTPDVAPEVMDRISRDAVTYPEQFDRRPVPGPSAPAAQPAARSAKRTMGRLAVFGVILIVSVALVVMVATSNAAGSTLDSRVEPGPGEGAAGAARSAIHDFEGARLLIGAIDGTLWLRGGPMVPAVTEAT